jgi:acyl-CoA synthetase (AMP-forming)/AMP-acid ligase II
VKVLHELKQRGSSNDKAPDMFHTVKWEVTSAISTSHILPVVKLILVPHSSISLTTSGKGRRSACVEHYRQDALERLDVSV